MQSLQEVPPGYSPVETSKLKTKAAKRNERKKEKRQQCLSWCTQIKGDLNSTCPGKTKRENQRSRLNSSDTDFSFNETRAPNFRAESQLQSGEGSRKRLV